MKRLLILPFLAALLLAGCDPAPSTALAPDQPAMPDAGKMTKEEVEQAHGAASAGGSDRTSPTGAPSGAPVGHGDTPADRQMPGGG